MRRTAAFPAFLLLLPLAARARERKIAPPSAPVLESATPEASEPPKSDTETSKADFQARLDRSEEAEAAFLDMCGALEAQESSDAEDVAAYVEALKREAASAAASAQAEARAAEKAVAAALDKGDIGARDAARATKRIDYALRLKLLFLYGNSMPKRLDHALQDADGRPAGRETLGYRWKLRMDEVEYESYRRMEDFNTDGLERYFPKRPPQP